MAPKKQTKTAKSGTKTGSAKSVSSPLDFGDDLATTDLRYGRGEKRDYLVTEASKDVQESRGFRSKTERAILTTFIFVALFLRLYKLSQPTSVVFDEVHFGGFARKYILGNFFMDVHPPLAKMLFGGFGYIFGFDGAFEFAKIGDEIPDNVPYVMMRAFSALCGVGTIFMMYNTLRLSGCKPIIALVTSSLLLVENSYFTISRYILLDAPLIFFIACTAFSLKRSELDTPFTFNWYKSLAATGVSLGLALSSKWVGLFTLAWVGLLTVYNLWFVLGDMSVSPKNLVKQTITKLFFFLAIPFALYLYFFSVHFSVLTNEGDGAAFMSAAFRSTLNGNKLPRNIPADVGVGSVVSIRHVNTQGGYLHSHNHLFETGSQQQQITLYPHLDENNNFQIELYNVSEAPTEFVPITDGTKIRLLHTLTKRRLHSHDHKPPVSEMADWQKEVSAYGFDGFEGDPNDDFIVEIVKSRSKKGAAQERVRAIETVFKLRHAMTGCYLFSHEVKLPAWAFEQQEVTCASAGIEPLLLWSVETNSNEFLPEDADIVNYEAPSFFSKFVESHKRMWKINQGLTDSHNWESTPDSWPFLLRGINYWGKNHTQVYLFGNLFTWWATTLTIVIFAIYVVIQLLRWQRGYTIMSSPDVFNYGVQSLHYLLGWGLHYAPSFLMGRQLFLHHYLPAYYFGILALGHGLEVIHSHLLKNKRQVSYAFLVTILAVSVTGFLKYSPLIKGDPWTKSQCESSKLMRTWDFDCNTFLDSPSAYESLGSSISQAAETSAPSVNFYDAVAVQQNDEFIVDNEGQEPAQEVNFATDQQQIPESEENVEFESAVEVEQTPESSAAAIDAMITGKKSTVAENPADSHTPEDEEIKSILHAHALKDVTTPLKPDELEPVKENVVIKRGDAYYDQDQQVLGDDERINAAKELEDKFPMDKLTLKQKRRQGDAIGTPAV